MSKISTEMQAIIHDIDIELQEAFKQKQEKELFMKNIRCDKDMDIKNGSDIMDDISMNETSQRRSDNVYNTEAMKAVNAMLAPYQIEDDELQKLQQFHERMSAELEMKKYKERKKSNTLKK